MLFHLLCTNNLHRHGTNQNIANLPGHFLYTTVRQSLRCLAEATERVKSGHSVVIFPEGTRYKGPEGGMGEFKGGAFRIATRAGAPLVPVAVCGSRAILEGDGHFTLKPGKVTIRILPPVETAGLSREELKALPARLEELVRRHVEEMAAEAAGKSAS